MDVENSKIEYRTPIWLSDSLKLHIRCSIYALRYLWIISAIILVAVLSLSAPSLWADPWMILMPMFAGLIGGTVAGPIVLISRRLFQKKLPELKAEIGNDGIKIIGQQGFSYEANWPNLTWIKEGSSAYVMRFNKLFVRFPKRGFVGNQESSFRNIVGTQAPAAALKWKV